MTRRYANSTIALSVLLLLIVCAALSYLVVHDPGLAIILVAVLCSVPLLVAHPHWLVPATLILAFTAFPAFVPQVIPFGGVGVLIYEPTLFLALAWTIARYRFNFSANAVLGALWALAMLGTVLGIAYGASRPDIVRDARGAIDVAAAATVAAGVLAGGRQRAMIRTTRAVLWLSAAITLVASRGNLTLQGREEQASLQFGASTAAVRLLSPATYLGIIVLCIVVALLVTGRQPLSTTWSYGSPALVIVFLAFSRNQILGLAVAIFAAICLNRAVVLRRFLPSVAGLAVVGILVALTVPGGGYFSTQIDSFQNRVLGGLSSSARATDASSQYRIRENTSLERKIPEHWYLGHGFGEPYQPPSSVGGNFTEVDGRYYAHEYYLWLVFKVGIVGLFVFLSASGLILFRAFGQRPTDLSVGFGAALCAILAISTVSPMPNDKPTAIAVGAVFGVLSVGLKLSRRCERSVNALSSANPPSASHVTVK